MKTDNEKGSILIVEDEKSMNEILRMLLDSEGYDVSTALDGKEGIEQIRKEIFDIVVTDIKMPFHDGFEILKAVKDVSPDTIVLMITAYGNTETAVKAVQMGAYDYINKPFKIDEIRIIIKNALEKRRLSREVKTLRSQFREVYRLDNIIGKSPKMVALLSSIVKVSENNSNVLITGESGCGKELIARGVHNLSKRANNEFVTINCAALPEGLLESELFGHIRGAFTGATSNKEGLFEVANKGSIFLDEIGEMPIQLQAKLLRVLEDGSFRNIGGTKDIHVDVRVISATNKNLKQEIETGGFRQDLYYRLNVIPLIIPPLRERKDDIPLLIQHFLDKTGIKNKKFTPKVIDILVNYLWPGNVRELQNTVERIVTLSDNEMISEDDLPSEIRFSSVKSCPVDIADEGVDLDMILQDIEMAYLQRAIEVSRGSKTDAAKLLNITFRQFRHRLKKYGIE